MKKLRKIGFLLFAITGLIFSSCSTSGVSSSKVVPVEEFTFGLSKTTIVEGETCNIINENIKPFNASDKRITYWVDNSAIASLQNGVITGLKAGTTSIYGKTLDGSGLKYSVLLTVSPLSISVSEFSFELSKTTIDEGASCVIINENIKPSNASDKRISYWVDNPDIASLENGVITGLKAGTTSIWGKTLDGSNIKCGVSLTVSALPILVSDIELSADSLEYYVGDSFDVSVNVLPLDASNKEVELVSSSDIVSINDKTITCNSAGTCTIKAVAKDGSGVSSNKLSITIKNITTQSITLSAEKTTLVIGATTRVSVEYFPEEAVDKEVTFSTKRNDIIRITSKGLITAVGIGEDYVVATLKSNPSITAELKIIVTDIEPEYVTLELPTTVYAGDMYTATAVVYPSDAFTKEVTYLIVSGGDIANINSDGELFVTGVGEFTVRVLVVERPNIKTDLVINSLEGPNPNDPYGKDIFEDA